MTADDAAAISLLKRAVELDGQKRLTEASVCYKEGLQLLMGAMKAMTDEKRKSAYRTKAKEYMDRAEAIDKLVDAEKVSGRFHEQVRIALDSTGHSYQALFGRFLDDGVKAVSVEDPYIRSHHQIMNFLRLCELLVKSCRNLSEINLLTGPDPNPQTKEEQVRKLEELQQELQSRRIRLNVSYSQSLHDREIRLSTGWQIKIGRGLDIYKAAKGKMVLGQFDLDHRQCYETVVDIFHSNSLAK